MVNIPKLIVVAIITYFLYALIMGIITFLNLSHFLFIPLDNILAHITLVIICWVISYTLVSLTLLVERRTALLKASLK